MAPKDSQPPRDLERDELNFFSLDPVVKALFKLDPELRALVEEAEKEGLFDPDNQPRGEQLWINKLAGSEWFGSNADFVRENLVQKVTDEATWKTRVEEGKLKLLQYAADQGLAIPKAEIDTLAEQFVLSDWENRGYALRDALIEYIDIDYGDSFNFRGEAGNVEEALRQTAARNGLSFSDRYYIGAVTSIQGGNTSQGDYERDIREQAASYWTPYADKILAGQDMQDLASSYMRVLADTHEMDVQGITLNNSYIKHALMQETPMGLWDFESYLREQPEWMETKDARDTMATNGLSILERMGFIGAGGTY